MTEKEIRDRLAIGEHIRLECKKAGSSELPKSIWETYSAFANTMGGIILLGVEEHKSGSSVKYSFSGVDAPAKMLSDFWNIINSDKVSHNTLLDKNVGVVDIDGKRIIYIDVPQANWRIKPIYINGNIYKGSYKRNHEGDYHCTEAEIKAMIRDSNEDGNDGGILGIRGL